MTYAASHARAILVALALTAALAASVMVTPADAHYFSRTTAANNVLGSNYGGHCGNGWNSWCYYQATPTIGARYGSHGYWASGYFQERRSLTLYGCYPHFRVIHESVSYYGEICYRL